MSHSSTPLKTALPCHQHSEETQHCLAFVSLCYCLDFISDIVSFLHSAEEIPKEVLRQREVKWLEMLNSWDKWMAKKHRKVCIINCKFNLTSLLSFI